MSIARLKREREDAAKKLLSAMKNSEGGNKGDDRFWKPTFNEEKGTGSAKIRFLPAPDGESLSYVLIYDHAFQGSSGKWYIENSLTTINQADPAGEMNSRLWNSGVEKDKDVARSMKRRKNYIANVLVLDDPANPDNKGKVKLFRFGPAVFEMLQTALSPEFEDSDPINPFDLWEGADFNIRIRMKEGYRSYDKSDFGPKTELFPGDDDKKEVIWKQCASLENFVSPSNFKTYEVLQKKLLEVLGEYVGSGIEVAPGAQIRSAQAEREEPAEKPAITRSQLDSAVSRAGGSTPKVESAPVTAGSESLDDFLASLN